MRTGSGSGELCRNHGTEGMDGGLGGERRAGQRGWTGRGPDSGQWTDSRQPASMLASTVVTNITCTWRTADSLGGERQPRAVLRAIIILLLCGYNIIVILLIAVPESLCRAGPLLFALCSAPPPAKATSEAIGGCGQRGPVLAWLSQGHVT